MNTKRKLFEMWVLGYVCGHRGSYALALADAELQVILFAGTDDEEYWKGVVDYLRVFTSKGVL